MGISFSKVNFKYNDENRYVLKDINTQFHAGKFNVILGPSGSGKSTLLKLINGLEKPLEGTVSINKHNNHSEISKKKSRLLLNEVGYVFQNPEDQFFADTVEKELYFGPNNKGIPKEITRKNIRLFFDLFNLDPAYLKYPPRNLSGGEMRKIAILVTLLMGQDIILLDEPTAGLDNKSKHNIFNHLKDIIKDTKKTIIVTTHEVDLALEMADYIFLIDNSEIIKEGTPNEIFEERNTNKFVKDILSTPYLELLEELETQFDITINTLESDVYHMINSALQRGNLK